jgi:hypothetical protein
MPDQVPEAQSAIREMEEARQRLYDEARNLYDSDDFKKQRDDARERYRKLKQRHDNLQKVIRKLREARIVWGPPAGDEIGRADKRSNPPTITLNDSYQGMRDAAIAQHLAHEAIHLLSERENSIDQEILCRRKELEVWELLKDGAERNALDLACENLQRSFEQGEEYVRKVLRPLYRGVPEKDGDARPSNPPPPPPPKRGHIRITGGDEQLPLPSPWRDFRRSFSRLLLHIFAGPVTAREYSFDIIWPRGYAAHETEGLGERFTGIYGVGPARNERAMPALFSVIEAPDVVHGGAWESADAWAKHRTEVWARFGNGLPGAHARVLTDESRKLDGLTARFLEAEYETLFREAEGKDGIALCREQVCYLQIADTLYEISLLCEKEDWASRALDFERALKSFRIRH